MNKLLLPLLILIPNVVFGQLTGNVSDENTGEPLAFATVSFESLSRGTITNEDGFFKLSCSQTLPDTLRVSFIGYQPLRLPIAQ
ncbi:MAG: carboxypeptidase-like regulatory domain-containing protein, partial [Flavobacteriales bacterium]|nr:carboxypeptidase-like regulatory domain-containing protein [Flavobacteriales bacterium]